MTALTREHLAKVAQIYASAISQGTPPAPVIAEHFSKPVTTVHRWVARARSEGLLPPTRQGLASGDAGLTPILAAELGIPEADLLTALRKHHLRLGVRVAQQ